MLTILSEEFGGTSLRKQIKEAVMRHQKCILLVPEQETLHAESVMAAFLPDDAPIYFEVTNFSRLANKVFRSLGGISCPYADKATEALLMWKALDAAAPLLSAHMTADESRVKDLLSTLSELYAAGVDETDLEVVARKLPSGDGLRTRMEDLALLFRLYKAERSDVFGSQAEDLDRLGAVLEDEPFFKNTLFFVDSFTSFTAQEYRILRALMPVCPVTVSLVGADAEEGLLCYEEIFDTVKRLCALARSCDCRVERSKGEPYSLPDAIAHAKDHLFRADKQRIPFTKPNNALRLGKAADPFDACAYIAADIAARVREGARFRDFVVFVRDNRAYRGILDDALEKQGIPYFMSAEKDVFSFAAIKMITSAYAVVNKGYKREDVISYLKCGFGDFSEDDVDFFELYADFWHIGGAALSNDADFSMHPFGYKTTFSSREQDILDRVNRIKREALRPLSLLCEAKSAAEHAKALYFFLRETRCEEHLLALAEREKMRGDLSAAEEFSRLFGVIVSLLDAAVEVLVDTPIERESFSSVLHIMFSCISLGNLPTSQDAVMVGQADMLRADAPRFVYLLGVNEGEFPAAVTMGGAFAENDRARLASLGLPIAFDPLIDASREEFCFLRALCAARESVCVLTCATDPSGGALYPSSVFRRLEELFSAAEAVNGAEVFHPDAAAMLFGAESGTAKGDALRAILSREGAHASYVTEAGMPITWDDEQIRASLAEKLFPRDMHLTQSRIDAYANCPFAYYCNYLLGLSYKKDASFDFADIGTLIHALLEETFLSIAQDKKSIKTITKEELFAYTDSVCRSYIDAICPAEMKESPRLTHLFARLSRTTRLLAEELYEEFAQSRFDPSFFEFKIGKDGAPDPIVFETEDGHRMLFHGTIDRVDSFRDEDGKVYLRVVDYKTGTKTFSVKDVKQGRNLQMLIYLFSLWKSRNADFLASIGLESNESPLPAGALYMSASPKEIVLDRPHSSEEVRDLAKKNLVRSGLILQDESIVRAMDATLSGRYVPIQTDKSGAMKWGEHFASLERMGELIEEMQSALSAIGTCMHKGQASATPASPREVGRDVCEGCAYHPICRKA